MPIRGTVAPAREKSIDDPVTDAASDSSQSRPRAYRVASLRRTSSWASLRGEFGLRESPRSNASRDRRLLSASSGRASQQKESLCANSQGPGAAEQQRLERGAQRFAEAARAVRRSRLQRRPSRSRGRANASSAVSTIQTKSLGRSRFSSRAWLLARETLYQTNRRDLAAAASRSSSSRRRRATADRVRVGAGPRDLNQPPRRSLSYQARRPCRSRRDGEATRSAVLGLATRRIPDLAK